MGPRRTTSSQGCASVQFLLIDSFFDPTGGSDPFGHTLNSKAKATTMFDFSHIDPETIGDGTGIVLPSGVYTAKIVSCMPTQSKNTGRAQFEFKLSITEAPYIGASRVEWISVPQSSDDKVVFVWARAFQSIGVPPEKLKAAGKISTEQMPNLFKDKSCFIEFTAGNRDMGQYDKCKFITEAAYKVKKEVGVHAPPPTQSPAANLLTPTIVQPAPSVSAPPVTVVTSPTSPNPGLTAGSSDLLALLNG
jgi:hypothetical protein